MSLRKILLIGDSDISRWPSSLYPECDEIEVDGFSGATLDQVMKKVPTNKSVNETILVFCAGENDDGCGLSVQDSLEAMDKLILISEKYFHLVFLGPKFEPWQNNDPTSRKHYIKLSKGLRRRCEGANNVTFVDCLTMFCGETANLPGAILGGKAKALSRYFHDDQLHLSEEGYQVWKLRVEDELKKLFPH